MNKAAVAEPNEPEVLDASKLLDGRLEDDMPEVNEAAIAAEEAKPVAAPAAPAAPSPATRPSGIPPIDSKGRLFDPMVHETLPDGSPKLRNNGQLSIRRHPLKAGKKTSKVATEAEATPPPDASPAAAAPAEDQSAQILAGAATCAGTQLMLMRVVLGEKLGQAREEQEELVKAWVGVFNHYGMTNFHPVVGLAMVSGGIVVAGMQHKETQGKLQRFGNWCQHMGLSIWQWCTGRRRTVRTEPQEPQEPAKAA